MKENICYSGSFVEGSYCRKNSRIKDYCCGLLFCQNCRNRSKKNKHTIDGQLLAQAIFYYAIVLSGCMAAVPVGITTSNFRGYCVMYADVVNDKIEFGATANCNFVTYVHVISSVLYGGFLGVLYTVAFVKNARGTELVFLRHVLTNLAILSINTFVTFLTLVSACVLSVGFTTWCNSLLVNATLHHGYTLSSCLEAQNLDWANVDGSSFYMCFLIATISSWVCLISWLTQTCLNIVVFVQQKRDDFGLGTTPLASCDNSPVHNVRDHIVPSSDIERY